MIVLLGEKVIQHLVVTLAFYINLGGIRSTVVPPWEILMVVGFVLGILYFLALVKRIRWKSWGLPLAGFLAVADIVGEFIAQGTIYIVTTVSFVVAWIVLILVLLEYRRSRNEKPAE